MPWQEVKTAYVRFQRPNELGPSMASGIQVNVPADATYEEAVALITETFCGEIKRYAAGEVARGMGFLPKPPQG